MKLTVLYGVLNVILGLLVASVAVGQTKAPPKSKRPPAAHKISREQVEAQRKAARELPVKYCTSAGRGDPECRK